MVRILNIVQGLISLVFLVIAAILGWPVWMAMIGLLVPIAISLVIVLVLKEETPKGKLRETIELLSELFIGIGGLLFWAFDSSVDLSLDSSMPIWLAVAGTPSMLFNLGLVLAWLSKGLETVSELLRKFFELLRKFFEICSGETVG